MSHFLYILFSDSKDKFYIGQTADVDFRLNLHNSHAFEKSFTKIASDWVIVLNYECDSKYEAIYLETFIKKMKSKKFIQKTINDNTILKEILSNKK